MSVKESIRPEKIDYYLNIAREVATRATCIRRKYGAIIVNNDEIISTGYCGAPRGCKNCTDLGVCKREELNIPSGQRYELCRSVHAEQNAMLSASRVAMQGATMYVAGLDAKTGEVLADMSVCLLCKKMLLNSGIEQVIMRSVKNGKSGHVQQKVSAYMAEVNE